MRWSRLLPFIGVLVFALALVVLKHVLAQYHYHELVADLRAIPARMLALAGALVVADYLMLTAYDAVALRIVGRSLAYGKTAVTAFIAFAFSHNIGYAALSGGSVRYRLYSAWGLASVDIAAVTVSGIVAFWSGFLVIGGCAFVISPPALPEWWRLPFGAGAFGVVALGLVAAGMLALLARRRPVRVGRRSFPRPPAGWALVLLGVGCADWLLVSGVVYALLPSGLSIGFPKFIGYFMLAQVAGAVSQVPGGLGVLEATLLMLLGDQVPKPALAGALIAYRVMYYLLPFGAAASTLCGLEVLRHRGKVGRAAAAIGRLLRPLVPHVFAVLVFVGGTVLIFSGATPAIDERLLKLSRLVPLAVVEASHFLASIAGMLLLLLARGLQLRLRAAYAATWAILVGSALLSLLKGFDYEEALLLLALAAAMLPFRSLFRRAAALTSPRFTTRWIVAIVTVLLSSFWLTSFCYEHVDLSGEKWWQVAFSGDAPRSLRAAVGISVLLLLFSLWRLLRPEMPRQDAACDAEIERARALLGTIPDTLGNLALLGDKALMFDDQGTAFVMFAIEGRSWISMGDPIGGVREREDLAWRFCTRCADHGGWPVFYQITRESLPLYLDLGLSLHKLGEEAIVDLSAFSIAACRKDLRRSYQRAVKEGCEFALAPTSAVDELLPELRRVSEDWLRDKVSAEKRFSLGWFAEDYLRRTPIALVRRGGRVVAFANVWAGGTGHELSFDLMRFTSDAPRGAMDFLLVELMSWGRAQGYRRFSLGMAPLSGLENRPHAPIWNRVGAMLFHHGEQFYNFRGLREYKEKFAPAWEPRYLACPGGLAVPRILANLSILIGGGWTSLLSHRAIARHRRSSPAWRAPAIAVGGRHGESAGQAVGSGPASDGASDRPMTTN